MDVTYPLFMRPGVATNVTMLADAWPSAPPEDWITEGWNGVTTNNGRPCPYLGRVYSQ